jgi:catechol 2,3-dioxygenase-like lactoylglutathione lyase family enzyme
MGKTATFQSIDLDRLGKVESSGGPKYLAHWVLKSAQRDKLVPWYQKVLGMELVFQNDMVTFLTYDHEHHRLAIIKLPAAAKPMIALAKVYRKFYGLDHIAFNFGSLRELLGKYRALKTQGVEPMWCINHGPTTSIYYEDPDGNRIEFQSDNFDTAEDLQQFATGLDFDKNPIGVNFDPDLLWEKLEAGVPEAELRQRGSATPEGKKPVGGMKAINWRTL